MPHTTLCLGTGYYYRGDVTQTAWGTPGADRPEWSRGTEQCLFFLGEPRGPLTSFAFSQDDMCLVFVAFATWAVRTSDLHAPDAWKTGLGAPGGGGGEWAGAQDDSRRRLNCWPAGMRGAWGGRFLP